MTSTALPGSGQLNDLSGPITDPSAKPGRMALDRQDWPAVQKFCQKRLRANRRDHFGHRYLGLSLAAQKLPDRARAAFEQALLVYPTEPVVLINFAQLLLGKLENERAYALCKLATEVAPGLPSAWILLMSACYMTGRHQEAVAAGQSGLAMPVGLEHRMLLLNNLSINLRDLGRMDEALAASREASRLSPTWVAPYMNQMLFLLSVPEASAMDIKAVADQYAAVAEAPHRAQWPRFENRDSRPQRRLRVGFLSPDLNNHAVMYFVEGLLPQLDRRQFEVLALYLQDAEHLVTQRVRHHVDEFHAVHGLDDVTLFKKLAGLNIDILIDLAGHTAANGLGALARRPAPVQVTWLGFPGTTGLTAIDWRITDGVADQTGAEAEYSEKLWRLPDVFCVYRPMSRFPLYRYQPAYKVRPTPALDNGYITFGSCNNLSKLTDGVLSTWAKVLAAVPNSRLLVEGKGLEDSAACDDFTARFTKLGVAADRLELIARNPDNQYLTYHKIDIALDPFPLTGGTTTTDLLWMGVPLVTMTGTGFRSRIGMTVLHALGHPEWIAQEEEAYVQIACDLTQDWGQLNRRRLAQRRRMETCPMMDESRFTQHFGAALRSMWHQWCARSQFPADPAAAQAALTEWGQHTWPAQAPQVTIGPGKVIGLGEAHQRLQAMTAEALGAAPRDQILAGCNEPPPITHPSWLAVLDWSEFLLNSIPNEPLALATLAELEHAHGRTDFAATYLHYAQEAMANQITQ
jgi:protein O-GlcNAc transferase